MSEEAVANNALKEFVDVFLRAEGSGDDSNSNIWGLVEELARRVIRQSDRVKRPHDVDPGDWVKARECMAFAAHSIVEKDKKGIDVSYILGFWPIVADTSEGAVDKMASTWKFNELSKALQYKFEYALKVQPFWITHEVLTGAEPRDIQLFLQALVAGKETDPMWHQPDAMVCENICVRNFYMPVIYTVHGTMEPGWSPEDVYAPCDFSQEGESAIMASFYEAFTLYGEQETQMQMYDIGLAGQVTNEARTARDLREIETRLEMIKAAVTQQEKSEHESNLEIQLTWGAGLGDSIEFGQAPVIRFSVKARNIEEDITHRLVLGVHVDSDNPESWGESLQYLLAICFRVGWPHVQVKQVSNEQAINYWTEANAPTHLM
jgi:hypothetical protein